MSTKIRLMALERRLKGRDGCHDLDPNWPGPGGEPRGPTLCVLYPGCRCGQEDSRVAATASSPQAMLALVRYLRELENAARDYLSGGPAKPLLLVLEKGAVLP